MPDLSTPPTSVENNAIPIAWTISRHVFQCLACMAWVSAGVRIARVARRWVCSTCAEGEQQ